MRSCQRGGRAVSIPVNSTGRSQSSSVHSQQGACPSPGSWAPKVAVKVGDELGEQSWSKWSGWDGFEEEQREEGT